MFKIDASQLKVMTIFGTRPEAIKMAPVVRALEACQEKVKSLVCITAQHRQMLDQVLDLFEIKPDFDLNVMQDGQSPSQVSSLVISKLEPILSHEKPDWVLIQGDTTTAMSAAIAAYYARVQVGHVEAGLRTFDKWQPFPEEINRQVIGRVADLHFAPTDMAKQNLLDEGISQKTILVTGNPVIDALHWVSSLSNNHYPVRGIEIKALKPKSQLCIEEVKLILVTAHRRENFGLPLENICFALRDIAEHYGPGVEIVYPVHANPNVKDTVYRILADIPNITLTTPLDYFPFVQLMKSAKLVLTDSGGVQEEAPGLGKPVLVMRDVTERPEAVQAGTVRLVGTDREIIVRETLCLLEDLNAYHRMARAVNPYGDGNASKRIVSTLLGEDVTPFNSLSGL